MTTIPLREAVKVVKKLEFSIFQFVQNYKETFVFYFAGFPYPDEAGDEQTRPNSNVQYSTEQYSTVETSPSFSDEINSVEQLFLRQTLVFITSFSLTLKIIFSHFVLFG